MISNSYEYINTGPWGSFQDHNPWSALWTHKILSPFINNTILVTYDYLKWLINPFHFIENNVLIHDLLLFKLQWISSENFKKCPSKCHCNIFLISLRTPLGSFRLHEYVRLKSLFDWFPSFIFNGCVISLNVVTIHTFTNWGQLNKCATVIFKVPCIFQWLQYVGYKYNIHIWIYQWNLRVVLFG